MSATGSVGVELTPIRPRSHSRQSRQNSTSSRERRATVVLSTPQHEQAMSAPSAASVPGPVLHSTPQRPARRRGLRSTLELPLASSQHPHAPEAHTHLGMLAQPDDAGLHGGVTTAPATRRVGRLDRVGTNQSPRHTRVSHLGETRPARGQSTEGTICLRIRRLLNEGAVESAGTCPNCRSRKAWSVSPRTATSPACLTSVRSAEFDVPEV